MAVLAAPAHPADAELQDASPRPTRPKASRRARLLRALGLLLVFAGLAAWYGPWRRPDLWKTGPIDRVSAWRQAHTCLNYTAPPDHLVCEMGPLESRDWFTTTSPESAG